MTEDGSTGRELGHHPVDQSDKFLSVKIVIDSIVSGGGISGRSSSVQLSEDIGIGVEHSYFDALAFVSRLRNRGSISVPGKYYYVVKTTPLGTKPAILVRLFLVPVGSFGTNLCGG